MKPLPLRPETLHPDTGEVIPGRDPRDVTDVFSRVDHDELLADSAAFLARTRQLLSDPRPVRYKASEILDGSVIELSVHIEMDWRFRLGLWVMKLGARIMRSKIKTEVPQ